MRRLSDFMVEDSSPPSSDPCECTLLPAIEGPKFAPLHQPLPLDDDTTEGQAVRLCEQSQEVLIHLLTPEVKREVPIPVWNEMTRLEVKIDRFLNSLMEER